MTLDPLIDQMAGNYRLVAKLGAGGMGEVYKAVHEAIGSKVAIKVLHATQAHDRAAEERFLLEAKAVNRIDHPGVVKVIDAGRMANGRPFLVMELLDGASLHELRKAGRLSLPDGCRAIVDVLDALATAHAAGVVHRDLKPPNIFRTRDGRTVVLDFGIAKLMAPEAAMRLTMTGSAVGTPHYMSPEQIRGLPVTPAVDIYAAGVVLFELLCNRRPFEADDDAAVFAAHLENRPPPPRALEPSIPIAVQDVVLTALAKDPARRFASAAAMRDALRAALDPETAATIRRAPPTIGEVAKPAQRATVPAKPARVEPPTVAEKPKRAPKPRPTSKRSRAIWFATGAIVLASATVTIAVVATRPPAKNRTVATTPEPTRDPSPDPDPWPADDLQDPWSQPEAGSASVTPEIGLKQVEEAISVSRRTGQLHKLPALYFGGAMNACMLRDKPKAQQFLDLMTVERERLQVLGVCAGEGVILANHAVPRDASIDERAFDDLFADAASPTRVKPRPRPDSGSDDPFGADARPETLVVTSVPTGATVYIDSKIVGETPWAGRVPGNHKLMLMLDGYKIHTQLIHADAKGTTRIEATLTKD